MTDLTGKVALVTGASRGIGAAAARALAGAGAKVALMARSSGPIEEIATEICSGGGSAIAVTGDVADWASVAKVVEAATVAFAPVDILVNNAGIVEPISRIEDSDPAGWGQVIDVNLKGVYYGTRAVLPAMIERGSGTIINIGSGAAHNALEGWSHYCASKAAVLMMSEAVHKECHDKGVISLNLSPGTVATEMQVQIKASGINPVSQLDPSVHIPAEWVAKAIVWLSGPEGAALAGEEVKLRDEETRAKIGIG